jgi:hypothetical protein
MIRLHPALSLAAVAVLTAAVAACSGTNASSNTNVNVAANNSSNTANIARQATEPRTNDPTADQAPPAPAPARAGTAAAANNEPPAPAPRARSAQPPAKISARHVLIQWMGSDRAGKSVLRTKEQAQVLAQEVLKRAKAGDDIGRLAVEYSDEPNAGPRGGSLGRFGKGQMVGAFEQTAFQLDVGEISGIVETPFGFHIIQRTE